MSRTECKCGAMISRCWKCGEELEEFREPLPTWLELKDRAYQKVLAIARGERGPLTREEAVFVARVIEDAD